MTWLLASAVADDEAAGGALEGGHSGGGREGGGGRGGRLPVHQVAALPLILLLGVLHLLYLAGLGAKKGVVMKIYKFLVLFVAVKTQHSSNFLSCQELKKKKM